MKKKKELAEKKLNDIILSNDLANLLNENNTISTLYEFLSHVKHKLSDIIKSNDKNTFDNYKNIYCKLVPVLNKVKTCLNNAITEINNDILEDIVKSNLNQMDIVRNMIDNIIGNNNVNVTNENIILEQPQDDKNEEIKECHAQFMYVLDSIKNTLDGKCIYARSSSINNNSRYKTSNYNLNKTIKQRILDDRWQYLWQRKDISYFHNNPDEKVVSLDSLLEYYYYVADKAKCDISNKMVDNNCDIKAVVRECEKVLIKQWKKCQNLKQLITKELQNMYDFYYNTTDQDVLPKAKALVNKLKNGI